MLFWIIVEQEMERAGMTIAPACEHALRQHLFSGENLLFMEREREEEAEENVRRFVREMIAEARSLGLSELHENTLAAAMSRLCPLWPIC